MLRIESEKKSVTHMVLEQKKVGKELGWNKATHCNPIESDFRVLPRRLAGKGGDKLSGRSVEKSWGQRHISLLVVLAAVYIVVVLYGIPFSKQKQVKVITVHWKWSIFGHYLECGSL